MSGALKSVGKVFQKVAKSPIGKVLAIAVAVGAIVFTAGAALGALPTFGAAIAGGVEALGISGTLGSILTGAVTSAGYGALAGGAIAGITGGNIMQGLTTGALTGAIGGGIGAGLGFNVPGVPAPGVGDVAGGALGETASLAANPAASIANAAGGLDIATSIADAVNPEMAMDFAGDIGAQPGAVNAGPPVQPPAPSDVMAGSDLIPGSDPLTAPPTTSAAPPSPMAPPPLKTTLPPEPRGLFDKGGWINENQNLVGRVGGGLVEGLGKGLLGNAQADAQIEAADRLGANQLARDAALREAISANYRSGTRGLLTQATPAQTDTTPRPTPAQRFNPRSFGAGQWKFNMQKGELEFVPDA